MTQTTRFNSIGLAGKRAEGVGSDQRTADAVADPVLKMYTLDLDLVANTDAQVSDFTLPDYCVLLGGWIRVDTASTSGTAQTIDIGINGGTTRIAAAASTASAGLVQLASTVLMNDLSAGTLQYNFGSANIDQFAGELVLLVIASDT